MKKVSFIKNLASLMTIAFFAVALLGCRKTKNEPDNNVNDVLRLRGAMIYPNNFKSEDLKVLSGDWKANHIRWQLNWDAFPDGPADEATVEEYDAWINQQCAQLDKMLPELDRYGVWVTLDLHTPPGGRLPAENGYGMRMFQEKKFQDAFVATWKKLSQKYKNVKTIWSYDILNSAVIANLPKEEGVLNWRELALKTSKEIRKIDPDKPIVFEPESWEKPGALFDPKEVPNVVYSFRMYMPTDFTMQGINNDLINLIYPGVMSDGKYWDKEQIKTSLQAVRKYAKDYGIAIYICEFGSIRWAPENSTYRYLKDCIEIFEEEGWNWAYHAFREWDGWSVEHSTDKNDHNRTTQPTDRELLLRSWFEKNKR